MPRHDFRTPRLFLDAPFSAGNAVPLDKAQANYLGNVLRLETGAPVLAFNGPDGEWRTAIAGPKTPEAPVGDRPAPPRNKSGSIPAPC